MTLKYTHTHTHKPELLDVTIAFSFPPHQQAAAAAAAAEAASGVNPASGAKHTSLRSRLLRAGAAGNAADVPVRSLAARCVIFF